MKNIKNLRYLGYKTLLDLHYQTQFKHLGSSLSCIDIVAYLWSKQMSSQDRFLMSKGHAVTALYTVFYLLGYIKEQELFSFATDGTRLGGHPSRHLPDLIPFATGSLGHGLSLAVGMAQSFMFQQDQSELPRVFCLLSDGECNVGQTWEAAAYAGAKKISNLIVLVDRNQIQAFDSTKNVLGDSSTIKRWQSFGFNALEIEGHNWKSFNDCFKQLKTVKTRRPTVIILNTQKGNGVSFMQNTLSWHYNTMNEVEYLKALEEIKIFKK